MHVLRRALTGVAVGGLLVAAVPTTASTAGRPSPITMEEQTMEKGLWDPLLAMYAHTAAAGDVNGDGWLDLYVGGFHQARDFEAFFTIASGDRIDDRGATEISPDRLLLGGPDGFTPDPSFPEMFDGDSSGSVFADLDGDGDLDLLISHYRNNLRDPIDAKVIVLRNDDGVFTRVGTVADTIAARALAVTDFDGDGNADLFVVEDRYSETQLGHPASSRLVRGDGEFGFTDVTAESGLPDDVHGLAAVAADLNGDGWPDLVVSGSRRPKDLPESPIGEEPTFERVWLFINNGDGTFTEADASEFTMLSVWFNDDSAGIAVGDLNRDGRQDLVIGSHPRRALTQTERGLLQPIDIYLNEGNDADGMPQFRDVTAETGISWIDNSRPAHITLADMDNDGWLDIATGVSVGDGTDPAIFRHTGLKRGIPQFETPEGLDREERTEPPEQSPWENAERFRYWVIGVNADFNRDGRVEMFAAEWYPALPSRYWENRTDGGNWINVEVGPEAAALGATVNVWPGARPSGRGRPIYSRQVLSTESYGGGALHTQHVGLGRLPVVTIEVVGPAPERTRVVRVAHAGQTVNIDLDQ